MGVVVLLKVELVLEWASIMSKVLCCWSRACIDLAQ